MSRATFNFRCCVIGEADLAAQCGLAILDRGGTVAVVVTTHAGVAAWAATRHIDVRRTIDEARAAAVDFLFSIVNPAVLDEAALRWPTRRAINYHNGPLPRYAGVHATSWAILNGEPEHGVVWHAMEPQIDAGPILRSATFSIGPRDAAFDLNVRCHEFALSTFASLLDDLAADRLTETPQDLTRRTYFAARKKDADAGIVRWDQPAERIDRVVRAHALGTLADNDFGSAIVLLADRYVVPTKIEVTPRRSTDAPGTILADADGALVVATATYDVRIDGGITADGDALTTPPHSLGTLGLRAGDRLPIVSAAEVARIAERLTDAARDEGFCAAAIGAATPFEPPFASSRSPRGSGRFAWRPPEVPAATRLDLLRLAAFVWLGRSTDQPISVRYSTDAMIARAAGTPLLVGALPLTLALPPGVGARDAAATVSAACADVERRGVHAADLAPRHRLSPSADALPIALHVGDAAPIPARFSIALAADGGRATLASTAHDDDELRAIAGQIDDALRAILARPDDALATLDLLSPADHAWLRTLAREDGPPSRETVADRWDAQLARSPEAVALEMGERSMTYRELDGRAEALADRLAAAGVGAGTLVGVCVERSFEMIESVLAVLKAGGAYVPIAVDLPAARRAALIEDAKLRHLIVRAEHRALFAGSIANVLLVDEPPASVAARRDRGASRHSAEGPAYVNFTSGSTGTPKGVLVPHRGIVRLCDEPSTRPGPSARVLHAAPLSFDAATYEIWATLLNGGTLALLPPGPPATTELASAISRHRIDTLFLTTALFNRMVDRALPAFAGVRLAITGGDVMSPVHARRLLDAHPACRLVNAYGPTENTSFSTTHAVPRDLDVSSPVPIGRPIRHSRAFVLDAARRPLPAGIVGELYVAGAGLAIGYLNRPELTAERFITDATGLRMYRTGDLAWLNAAGVIHFVGRADRQVKVRGFRIEPGEVEAAINAQPGVEGSAVIAREDGIGGRRLVAYVVARAGASVDLAVLRKALADRLPDYMEPAAWVTLPALPMTPTGKLDRAALPTPADAHAAAVRGRPPTTAMERSLCDLLARSLGVADVDLDDDFFALGGHSLQAAEFVARVRETLGIAIPLRTLFERPTIGRLIAELPHDAAPPARPTLARRARPEPMPLSPTQRRLWFLQQLDGPSPTYNINVAHRLEGDVDVDALRAALADVTARHESLRTIFPTRGGVACQHVVAPELGAPPLVVELCAEFDLAARIAAATGTALDLSQQTPLHAWLFTLAPRRHVLLLVLHHIAGDGWSLRPLWSDLSRAYASRRLGATPAFASLLVQYADYTLWHRDVLGDPRDVDSIAARQLAFWRTALAGAPQHATLRTDFPRPARSRQRGASVSIRVDASLRDRLARLARDNGASLFMALQAAFASLLARELSAGDDVIIGTPIAGRGDAVLDDQVGFYVNTLALRLRLDGRPTFRELINRARTFALDAYANQDVPFDDVVQVTLATRSTSHSPLFQAMVALDNTPAARPTLDGLIVTPEPLAATSAKVDLLLALSESADGIVGAFEYDVDLFAPATVRRLAARWTALLAAAVAEPDRPMADLSAADASTLPDMLAAAAGAYGDRPALLAADREPLTHAGLSRLLADLAAQLRALGVAREDRVAIVLPNGPTMAVAFLAVASVAAAAPLNPAYRAAEFEFFLDDLDARALLVADGANGPAVDVARSRGLPIIRIVEIDGRARFVGDAFAASTPHAPPSPSDVALVLHTSGTTARPKLVPLSHENVCASARNVAASLALTPDDRCLNVMPLFHIHGLVAALLSSLGAGAAVIASDGFDATKMLGWLGAFRPTWYTAVPTMHAAILDRARGDAAVRSLAPLRLIRSSSSALPPTVAAGLEDAFGVPVIEAYGMTEAAHQMCCNPLPPAARKPGSVGLPAGPEVAIMDANGALLPRGASGEVVIRGRNVTAGYAANDAANVEAFAHGWFHTGDLGHVDADGYLFLSGRSKEIINRGGEKISPREIDETLLEHPSIAQAVAFAMPDARLGEEVAVAVVLRAGAALSERDVMTFAAGRLSDFKVPRRVVVLDELPKGATGKVQRVGLARALGLVDVSPSAAAAYVEPATVVERRLAAIWREVLGRDRVGTADRFFDLGGDSVLAAQVIARVLDSGLGELSIVAFFARPTIGAMAATLHEPTLNASPPPADESRLASILADIESLSDDEVERLLAAEETARDGGNA